MTDKPKSSEAPKPETTETPDHKPPPPTQDELKAAAEALSDAGRQLLARLSERYESGLNLPADQVAFDELVEGGFAVGTHGVLVRLTPDGQALAAYLGPYEPFVPVADRPALQPPADPADVQEEIRKRDDAEREAAEKAAKEAAKKAAA